MISTSGNVDKERSGKSPVHPVKGHCSSLNFATIRCLWLDKSRGNRISNNSRVKARKDFQLSNLSKEGF
jgi:hypothetical protein